MVDWVEVPLAYQPFDGPSDVFSRPGEPLRAPMPARAAVSSPRQEFFEKKLRAIAWLLGTDAIPAYLNFEGERRQLDKGCVGHAVANGVLSAPENGPQGWITQVVLRKGDALNDLPTPQVEQTYFREAIPALFGQTFSTGSWNQGFVVQGNKAFLLVTLDKSVMHADHQYEDGFVSPARFRWQSQNRTTRDSLHGRIISGEQPGYELHLFVRDAKLQKGKGAPFAYCGTIKFDCWQGEAPISVVFTLDSPLTDERFTEFHSA